MSDQHLNAADQAFHKNTPRPPVPGEEGTHTYTDWGGPPTTSSRCSSSTIKPSAEKSKLTESSESPACLRWAISLHLLLQDPDGVQLFKKFLLGEGHADILDFWFACEGLKKQTEPDNIQKISRAIYRRFFMKLNLPISEEIKRELGRALGRTRSSVICSSQNASLFDEAQMQIKRLINDTSYPNFIKSDIYLQYVEILSSSTDSESSSSSSSNKESGALTSSASQLPTIHEDKELSLLNSMVSLQSSVCTATAAAGYATPPLATSSAVRLTKDSLLATQKNRALDVRPRSETFAADMYMYRPNALHLPYNSYNPVSRQDSEMQSISSHSDARTESDTMSLTDSSVDGRSLKRSNRRRAQMEARHARESAELNKEAYLQQTLIPRTQLVEKQQCQPLPPDEFAAILIQKLESVKREQDKKEILERKLSDSEQHGSAFMGEDLQARELANAIREKLQAEEDSQQILDEHVSIVFSDNTSHALSPGESPRAISPRGWPRSQGLRPVMRRKERDGFSTFSGDSGNVHDFHDVDTKMVKSRSMPDYQEEKFSRGSLARRSSSKKTPTEFTDSGVSVVSDTPPDSRVLAWLMESGQKAPRTSSATSSNLSRHRKTFGSRSDSLERSPAQPFVADPSMPPLPLPNTAVQLEEARRRLMEDDLRMRSRPHASNRSSKHFPEAVTSYSSHSTLRKSTRGSVRASAAAAVAAADASASAIAVAEDVTTVVFSFCEEEFPYRTKIPGRQVTLKQFKEILPKKGNYRFFFKTVCEELGQVIQEEVSRDQDVLPLWEGRINAQVKPID